MDIKAEAARAKMCCAWAKSKGLRNSARIIDGKVVDDYPLAMEVETLMIHLPFPELALAVHDVHENYLKRHATRKYILFDYPESIIKSKGLKGDAPTLNIPPVLSSLINDETRKAILASWREHFDNAIIKA